MIRKDTNKIILSRDEVEEIIAKHLAKHDDSKDIQLSQKVIEFDYIMGNQHQINFNVIQLTIRDK
jgi:hypothetical protein